MKNSLNNQKQIENSKEILNGIQKQISSIDTKASFYLLAISIFFSFFSSLYGVFHEKWFLDKNFIFIISFKVLFILLTISSILIIIFFILVIWPRTKKIKKLYPNYYMDVFKLDKKNLKKSIKKYNENDDMIVDQIKINSRICRTKHNFLKIAFYSFIPFGLILFSLTIMILFG
ncbi:hypothetical protein DMC14_003245 [Metamycoplasma phocicerebrale]|uniref:Pycsar effector protein domain-containing protein n=1 Tax=Metamycoplasma phocicerebrale TaxID=142649 RepID=A0A3Q9V9V5_9BACT|nr:Pycsar system effector family protein [Metamycoplasma phocicerebrale]AZZ65779.1 hypothetical protein DMC14_003245 [Metamycoplasma phocicerebrale]